jgi:hypothetical protein
MKKKIIFILKRYSIMLFVAIIVFALLPFTFPMGEYTGLSWLDMFTGNFNLRGITFISAYFTFILLFVSHRVFKIKLIYALFISILIATYMVFFEIPGYFMQYLVGMFDQWGDVVALVGIIIVSLVVVHMAPLKTRI